MPEAAGEVREQTFWCRVYRCPNHVPRRSVGIPLGWMRLALGLPGGKAHNMTFCSAACLQATLLWRPQEFACTTPGSIGGGSSRPDSGRSGG